MFCMVFLRFFMFLRFFSIIHFLYDMSREFNMKSSKSKFPIKNQKKLKKLIEVQISA